MKKLLLLCCAIFCLHTVSTAKVHIDSLFTDNMVIQRDKPVALWGKADSGERIKIRFAGKNYTTTAKENGSWKVFLKPHKADSNPQKIHIFGKGKKITLNNILVGDVWIASGQSNMQYSMTENMPQPQDRDSTKMKTDYENANDRNVRVMLVRKDLSKAELPTDGWHEVNMKSLKDFSAVAYYYAHDLADSLNIPIGIIASSWGGSPIESWIPEAAYQEARLLDDSRNFWKYNKCPLGDKYAHMIEPLTGLQISGFIWYQGEANLSWHETDIYADKQRCLINSWRKAFGDATLPFYYVQITPYNYSAGRYRRFPLTWDLEAEFWTAQQSCLDIINTAMVYTTDLTDNVTYLHPSFKWKVGERLAKVALNRHYGKKEIVCEGPTFKSMDIDRKNNTITISFSHTEGGLHTRNGKEPDSFCVKDKRGRFAQALSSRIEGNNVILNCKSIAEDAAVRFGWDEASTPNLENGHGLPAVVFMKEYKE